MFYSLLLVLIFNFFPINLIHTKFKVKFIDVEINYALQIFSQKANKFKG